MRGVIESPGKRAQPTQIYLVSSSAVRSLLARAQVRSASLPDAGTRPPSNPRRQAVNYRRATDARSAAAASLLGFELQGHRPCADGLRLVDTTRTGIRRDVDAAVGEVATVRTITTSSGLRRRSGKPAGGSPWCSGSTTASGSARAPRRTGSSDFPSTDELTEFALADDARAWWIPSESAEARPLGDALLVFAVSVIDSVQTPLTLETRDRRTFM